MSEYIDREAAIEIAEKYGLTDGSVLGRHSGVGECVSSEIAALPAADVVPSPCWIPVSERLPKPETEVMIVCNRNGWRFIATAIHEDGTLFKEDSDWFWNDIWEYGRYDEERDDYIIPEGWWESRCFTPDDVYNCPVDCEVTHWMPMPELPEEKNDGDK